MPKLKEGRLYPFFEAVDTFLRTPGTATGSAPHVRDAMDLKRVMMIVLFALIPCVLFAPVIDKAVVGRNVRRRRLRSAA